MVTINAKFTGLLIGVGAYYTSNSLLHPAGLGLLDSQSLYYEVSATLVLAFLITGVFIQHASREWLYSKVVWKAGVVYGIILLTEFLTRLSPYSLPNSAVLSPEQIYIPAILIVGGICLSYQLNQTVKAQQNISELEDPII